MRNLFIMSALVMALLADLCGINLKEVCAGRQHAASAIITRDTMMTHINEHSVLPLLPAWEAFYYLAHSH